jgi:long-subunit fatty acid transport protein
MDQTRYGVSIGAGYGLTENLSIDAAYSAVFTHNRTIANNVGSNTTGNAAYNIDGTYSDFANVLALNITYKFGGK